MAEKRPLLRQVEDTTSIIPALPKKVFNMCFDPDRREIYLEEFADEFHFDFKVYGEKRFFKISNLENKPSLYRGGLAY